MEINIDSKRNNPLLNRTEVHFTIIHEGEKTPNRDLVRTELAEKLNSKKEKIIVNYINPGFGKSQSTGYAKIYDSVDKIKDQERKFLLKRNTVGGAKKEKPKEEKKDEKPDAGKEEKPSETKDQNEGKEDKPEEKTEEKPEDKPKEESNEKPAESEASKDEKLEEKSEENKEEKPDDLNKEDKKE